MKHGLYSIRVYTMPRDAETRTDLFSRSEAVAVSLSASIYLSGWLCLSVCVSVYLAVCVIHNHVMKRAGNEGWDRVLRLIGLQLIDRLRCYDVTITEILTGARIRNSLSFVSLLYMYFPPTFILLQSCLCPRYLC